MVNTSFGLGTEGHVLSGLYCINIPIKFQIPVVNKEIKAIATLEDNGTKLKFVSQTDKGEEIRTYQLSADGKEMIMVCNFKYNKSSILE